MFKKFQLLLLLLVFHRILEFKGPYKAARTGQTFYRWKSLGLRLTVTWGHTARPGPRGF